MYGDVLVSSLPMLLLLQAVLGIILEGVRERCHEISRPSSKIRLVASSLLGCRCLCFNLFGVVEVCGGSLRCESLWFGDSGSNVSPGLDSPDDFRVGFLLWNKTPCCALLLLLWL